MAILTAAFIAACPYRTSADFRRRRPQRLVREVRGLMRGELDRESPEHYTRFTLYTVGRAEVEATGEEAEFPRIAPAVTGRRRRPAIGNIGAGGKQQQNSVGVAGTTQSMFALFRHIQLMRAVRRIPAVLCSR